MHRDDIGMASVAAIESRIASNRDMSVSGSAGLTTDDSQTSHQVKSLGVEVVSHKMASTPCATFAAMSQKARAPMGKLIRARCIGTNAKSAQAQRKDRMTSARCIGIRTIRGGGQAAGNPWQRDRRSSLSARRWRMSRVAKAGASRHVADYERLVHSGRRFSMSSQSICCIENNKRCTIGVLRTGEDPCSTIGHAPRGAHCGGQAVRREAGLLSSAQRCIARALRSSNCAP
jgi:hypothetical protein